MTLKKAERINPFVCFFFSKLTCHCTFDPIKYQFNSSSQWLTGYVQFSITSVFDFWVNYKAKSVYSPKRAFCGKCKVLASKIKHMLQGSLVSFYFALESNLVCSNFLNSFIKYFHQYHLTLSLMLFDVILNDSGWSERENILYKFMHITRWFHDSFLYIPYNQ